MDISGKRAVVTGGGSGIGRSIALAFARHGADVIVADIEGSKAEAVAQELATHGGRTGHFTLDVRDATQVAALADHAWNEFGGIDILCNNAGVCAPAAALAVTDDDFAWHFGVNVNGVFNGMREFVRRFLEQGTPAHIINTGSHNAIAAPVKGVSVYVASKHAVLGLTEAYRTEFGDKIGFGILCPGIINTSIWDCGRNRPVEFGGKFGGSELSKSAITTFGMRPERVGELVAEGIRNEDFFIWTHPQDIELITARYRECKETIERQWPDGPDKEHQQIQQEVI